MYLPRHFEQNDRRALLELARAHPLATVVVEGASGVVANHLPLLVDDGFLVLRGHVARANPLWQALGSGVPALVIFHGPQAYVSPSLYPGKALHGQVVPTWNYAVVHAHGRLRAVDDAVWIRELLDALTASHEVARTPAWQLDDAPVVYAERMVKAVVGIELAVDSVTGKFKLSQNRDAADRAGVRQGVADSALGDLMAEAEATRGAE